MSASHSKAVSWGDVEAQRTALLERFPYDRFLRDVLKGVMRVGRDKGNPIRGNLAASGLREVVSHVLHGLAPDEEVRECVWFEQDARTATVTRAQRAGYIVHAGLPKRFVEGSLHIDVRQSVQPVLDAMKALNKRTHVTAETTVQQGRVVRGMTMDVLVGLVSLLEAAAAARDKLQHAIEEVIEHAVFERFIMDTIVELDELSTHTRVDDHDIDTVELDYVDASRVGYVISGKVWVELQYGSDADVRSDIGFQQRASYPYRATASSAAAKPMEIDGADVQVAVDTRSFDR